jgi:transcriptional regulator with XRE-family HTH domain
MILADKITDLRKKSGWSQEELAEKMGVSRQSISKWESAQSVPDMKKIVKMSELFGVSTDYLLKDEIEEPEPAEDAGETTDDKGEKLVPVSMEEASAFLDQNERNSFRTAVGSALCVLSPILLVVLSTLGESGITGLTEDQGSFAGVIALIAVVALAVMQFTKAGIDGERFEYLKKENIDTEYGVDGMVKERMHDFEPTYRKNMTVGITLCVLSVIPVMIAGIMENSAGKNAADFYYGAAVGALLAIVAAGVFLIVRVSSIKSGFQILMEQGDYSRDEKSANKAFGTVFWLSATAVYLFVSFITERWELTWIIWVAAAAIYSLCVELYKMRRR